MFGSVINHFQYVFRQINLSLILRRIRFNRQKRIDLYRSLNILLRNKIAVELALKRLYEAYSGVSPGRKAKKNITAKVLQEASILYRSGASLHQAFSAWVPHEECLLIQSGEISGTIPEQLGKAIELVKNKGRFFNPLLKCFVSLFFLFGSVGYLFHMAAYDMIPTFLKITDPSTWGVYGNVLYYVSQIVINYGTFFMIAVIFIFLLALLSLPYSFGDLRVRLDFFPPWSIYRIIHGANFLMNISVLISSGISLKNAIIIMKTGSSPWLLQRLDSILYGLGNGRNFGVALEVSGYNFPDKDSIPIIKVLAETSKIDEVLYDYATEWVERSIDRIEFIAAAIMYGGAIIVTLLLLLVTVGANSIVSSVQHVY